MTVAIISRFGFPSPGRPARLKYLEPFRRYVIGAAIDPLEYYWSHTIRRRHYQPSVIWNVTARITVVVAC